MDGTTVTLRVPPLADHVTLLRTVVSGVAARREFTLEQVDDLRMAVEEAAVQLLRHGRGEPLVLDTTIGADQLDLVLSTTMADGTASVVDEDSLSWMILQALADEVSTSIDGTAATLRLVKYRRATDSVEA